MDVLYNYTRLKRLDQTKKVITTLHERLNRFSHMNNEYADCPTPGK